MLAGRNRPAFRARDSLCARLTDRWSSSSKKAVVCDNLQDFGVTMFKRIVLTAAIAVLATGAALADSGELKARKEGFEANKKAMGEIKKILEKGEQPVAAIALHAQRMGAFAAQVPGLFPVGSDKGDTKAKPAIWAEFPDFEAKAKAFEAAALKLAEVAAGGEKEATARQFGALAGTCKACHERYRAE
jgi:cytochrome c556